MVEMTGQEIYDNFHGGIGPEGLATGASLVKKIAGRYQERVREIHQLVVEMESAWEGDAAGAARRGARPLLKEHDIASHHFSVSEDLTDRQSGSFSRAKNSVVPVPPAPGEVPPWGPISPEWVPYLENAQAHSEAARHNVEVMTGYSGASTYNTDNLPTRYGDLADDQSGASVDEGDTIDSGSFGDDSGDSGPRGGGPFAGPPPGPDPAGPGPGGSGPGGSGPGGSGPSTETPPPGASAPPLSPGADPTSPSEGTTPGGYSPLPGPHPGTPLPGGDFAPARPSPTGAGPLAGVGFGPIGPGGGYSSGDVRGGPGASAGGPRGGLSPVPRGAVTGTEPLGPAGRSGSPSVPGAGRGGGAGMHGMPVGGGRGRDEEDAEHKAPTYLEGGDPEDLFGSEILTAPPVIGEEDD